jgi:hypothetical protein
VIKRQFELTQVNVNLKIQLRQMHFHRWLVNGETDEQPPKQ